MKIRQAGIFDKQKMVTSGRRYAKPSTRRDGDTGGRQLTKKEVLERLKRERAREQRRIVGLGRGFRGTPVFIRINEEIEYYTIIINQFETGGN